MEVWFSEWYDVPANGSHGGLSLGWKNDCNATLCSFNEDYIDVMIMNEETEAESRFTGFYGAPDSRQRSTSWDLDWVVETL